MQYVSFGFESTFYKFKIIYQKTVIVICILPCFIKLLILFILLRYIGIIILRFKEHIRYSYFKTYFFIELYKLMGELTKVRYNFISYTLNCIILLYEHFRKCSTY